MNAFLNGVISLSIGIKTENLPETKFEPQLEPM